MERQIIFPVLILFLAASSTEAARSKSFAVKEVEILDNIFNASSYDRRIRPFENDDIMSPTEVRVNMFIRMIGKIDDIHMQYNLQVTLRQKWLDRRLKYNNMEGNIQNLVVFEELMWTPDLFISNEKSGYINNLMKPNTYYRIFPDGTMLYSSRLSLVLSCPMDFKYFPFDSQVCSMRMASYGYTTNDVVFEWEERDAVQMVKNLAMHHFSLESFSTDVCHSKTNTGTYSCLSANFFLKRNLRPYIVYLFVPTLMFVVLSWLVFWLDIQCVGTRLFTVLATLLALTYKVHAFNEGLPVVDYTRSVDVWTGTCLLFVFMALVEVVTVDYRLRQQQKKQRRAAGILETGDEENGIAIDMKPLVAGQGGSSADSRPHPDQVGRLGSFFYRLASKLPTGPKRLDAISRFLFPTAFLLFNVFYWLVNLVFYEL